MRRIGFLCFLLLPAKAAGQSAPETHDGDSAAVRGIDPVLQQIYDRTQLSRFALVGRNRLELPKGFGTEIQAGPGAGARRWQLRVERNDRCRTHRDQQQL